MLFQIGLQRSGTNYIHRILSSCGYRFDQFLSKHLTRDEFAAEVLQLEAAGHDLQIDDIHFVLIARHPVLWAESLLNRCSHDFKFPSDIKKSINSDTLFFLGRQYDRFFRDWLEDLKTRKYSVVRYESLLKNGADYLIQLGLAEKNLTCDNLNFSSL